jgi:phosphotriesterase-related protein
MDGMTPAVERVARAASLAHHETGAPISTHTHAGSRSGSVLQQLLESCGVEPDRLIIGHSGDSEDLDYLRGLLARGSYLGMDRFGAEDILSDARRMDVVATLCSEGHAERLLLSQDANCWNDRQTRAEIAERRPHWHHRRVIEHVIPGLLERGVTRDQVDVMMFGNPRTLLDVGR